MDGGHELAADLLMSGYSPFNESNTRFTPCKDRRRTIVDNDRLWPINIANVPNVSVSLLQGDITRALNDAVQMSGLILSCHNERPPCLSDDIETFVTLFGNICIGVDL